VHFAIDKKQLMPDTIKEHFADTSFHLAKALHFNKVSQEYFTLLKIGAKGETKNLFNQCIQRSEWIYNNIHCRLSDNSRAILKQEMSDSLAMDAIIDELVLLTPENRATIENLIKSLNKGETIEFVQQQNY